MPKPAFGVTLRNFRGGNVDRRSQLRHGSCADRLQNRFHLRPAKFDWVEVGRVRRHVEDARARLLDQLSNARGVMGSEVIHHYDVADVERWTEVLAEELEEDMAICSTNVRHQCSDTSASERTEHREDMAAVAWNTPIDARADGAPGIFARHRDVRSRLVDEDESVGIERGQLRDEAGARLKDARAIAFARHDGLFFRERPSLASARPIVARLT